MSSKNTKHNRQFLFNICSHKKENTLNTTDPWYSSLSKFLVISPFNVDIDQAPQLTNYIQAHLGPRYKRTTKKLFQQFIKKIISNRIVKPSLLSKSDTNSTKLLITKIIIGDI